MNVVTGGGADFVRKKNSLFLGRLCELRIAGSMKKISFNDYIKRKTVGCGN